MSFSPGALHQANLTGDFAGKPDRGLHREDLTGDLTRQTSPGSSPGRPDRGRPDGGPHKADLTGKLTRQT